ncbi:MAG: DnaJ domain-containing protein [Hyphomicrobiaceae bacterium]
MFERNRIEHQGEAQKKGHIVEVALSDGSVLKGKIFISVTKSLADELNGSGTFLEFHSVSGDKTLLSKARIATVTSFEAPRADQLERGLRQIEGFDAYDVLRVERGASLDEIKSSYHRLAKAYHPDRFAATELPPEMADYVAAIARRLNLAYAMLQDERSFAPSPPPRRAHH